MKELSGETQAELPWAGGWIVTPDGPNLDLTPELHALSPDISFRALPEGTQADLRGSSDLWLSAAASGTPLAGVFPYVRGGTDELDSGLRVLRTVRWLRWRQITGQLRRRLLGAPLPSADVAPTEDPVCRWKPLGPFAAPGPGAGPAQDLASGRFVFLNDARQVGWPPSWEAAGAARLWRYNLHYFDYLWQLDYEAARTLVDDWIARHRPGRSAIGWEPYPLSLRLMNWCACFFGRDRALVEADSGFRRRLWGSIRLQADLLERNPETHLLGNHLLENAAALALAGACFAGTHAERWLRKGLALLDEELPEQVLSDGGHFERSPMYHARLVTLLAQLENTGDSGLMSRVGEPLARARRALAAMTHPDGDIALLNDAAFGIAAPALEICGGPPPDGAFALRDSGYYGARAGGHYVVCDAAPIGPDYLPGHGHADIFSFEMSLHGARVVVDAGVHDYDVGELRDYCRSTRAHNTVEVDGQDQCELWGSFRVARRGRPRDVHWSERDGGFLLSGWHDGYRRMPGRPRHERTFRWHPEGVLLVRDRVSAGREVATRTAVHLHPDCGPVEIQGLRARIEHPRGAFTVAFVGSGELLDEKSLYCPRFGVTEASRCLVFEARGRNIENGFCIAAGEGTLLYDLCSGARVDDRRFDW